MVGGGGGAGANNGGAVAAVVRRILPHINEPVTVQNYPFNIGAGGAGSPVMTETPGSNGGNTTAFGLTAKGGGGGGSGTNADAHLVGPVLPVDLVDSQEYFGVGGSGNFGFPGGPSGSDNGRGGGGGGAGGAGGGGGPTISEGGPGSPILLGVLLNIPRISGWTSTVNRHYCGAGGGGGNNEPGSGYNMLLW